MICSVCDVLSQPIINIWGAEDQSNLKNQILEYMDMLEIDEDINLVVGLTSDISEDFHGMTYLDLNNQHLYQTIIVKISSQLSEYKLNQVLAHEMVHVKQLVKEELELVNDNEIMWKEKMYVAQFQHNEFSLPWEQEAYLKDNRLAKAYKALQSNKL